MTGVAHRSLVPVKAVLFIILSLHINGSSAMTECVRANIQHTLYIYVALENCYSIGLLVTIFHLNQRLLTPTCVGLNMYQIPHIIITTQTSGSCNDVTLPRLLIRGTKVQICKFGYLLNEYF